MLANKHAKIMLVLVFAVLGFMLATQRNLPVRFRWKARVSS